MDYLLKMKVWFSILFFFQLLALNVAGKTVTLVKNILLEKQITQKNVIYVIRHRFDLQGESVSIPDGCTLRFEGGCITNGILTGRETYVELKKSKPVFKDVLLKGIFKSDKFPINCFISNKLDFFYSFLQAFSGTNLYLIRDYSVTDYLGEIDGATPRSLVIDGRGHKLTLYSFGAYKLEQCCLKNITIESRNNISPKNKWKTDKFNFGLVGCFEKSTLEIENVTFTKECGHAYLRGFKKLEISNCSEDGSYFFVYDCDNVSFHNNSIANSTGGYYSIGRQTESGKVEIHDNVFRNINGGGIILSGGLKYNVSIVNNELENVGGGGAMKSGINIHPRGTINVSNNRIIANKGASTLDIDAARAEYYSNQNVVTVENNVIELRAGESGTNSMALVGLAKLYLRNNSIKDQVFYFWDTPYMEFCNNTVSFSQGFDKSTYIGKMSTHPQTESYNYKHIYRNNTFDIPYAKGYVFFEYISKAPVRIIGEGNAYSNRIDFVDQYKKFDASGDIKIYR